MIDASDKTKKFDFFAFIHERKELNAFILKNEVLKLLPFVLLLTNNIYCFIIKTNKNVYEQVLSLRKAFIFLKIIKY